MKSFSDHTGKAWHIKITIGNARTAPGVDLIDGDPSVFVEQFMTSVVVKLDLLWHFLLERKEEPSLTRDEFEDKLEGESYLGALEALEQEILFFIQAFQPHLSQTIEKFIAKYRTISQKHSVAMMQLADDPRFLEAAERELETLKEEAIQKLSTMLPDGSA